eukprot:129059_1
MSYSLTEAQQKKFEAELRAVLRKSKYQVHAAMLEELWSVVDFDQNGLLDDVELKVLIKVVFGGLKRSWTGDEAKRKLLNSAPVDDIAMAITYGCGADGNGEVSKHNFMSNFLPSWNEMINFYTSLCNSLHEVKVFGDGGSAKGASGAKAKRKSTSAN